MKSFPLTCPCKLKCSLTQSGNHYLCDSKDCVHNKKENAFGCFGSIPILISSSRTDTVCSELADVSYVERPLAKFIGLKKIVLGESDITQKSCEKFVSKILENNVNPKVLVIGGGEQGFGTDKLWSDNRIEIHSVDIYASDYVDIICDAHYLPLKSACYDGVWIQAVLEHVVEPIVVVEEIHRVLKHKGIVYAETPFMQQVHEGRYDFTRYTVLGHRYLFKRFKLLDIGGNQGPELVLAWSFRYLVWALFRNRQFARVLGILAGLLLRPLAFFTSKKAMYDSSSTVFFLGVKSDDEPITHKELIRLYKGNL